MSLFTLILCLSLSKTRKRKKAKENKIKMGYFKLRNMHLLKHGSNKKKFKPRTQEDNYNHLHRESQPPWKPP